MSEIGRLSNRNLAIQEMMTDGQMEEMRSVGECDFAYEIVGVSRYRVNAYMSMGAPAIALRAIPTEIPPLSALGIPQTVVDLYQKKHGLILLTGPTGCGKSTTIASILNVINQTKNLYENDFISQTGSWPLTILAGSSAAVAIDDRFIMR